MTFLRYEDNIINLERITRVYREEIVCERPTGFGFVTLYKVVLAGDGQELKIKCDSAEEADKKLDSIWEILKKCSQNYFF